MKTPTRTTNELHFTDLSARRFEDLCHALVYSLKPWVDIRHYGRAGADGGVDLLARERLENDTERLWFVQCRRQKEASLSDLKRAVDDTLRDATVQPDVLLVVLACDVQRRAHEGFVEYAAKKGVHTPILWTAANLEAKLYSERKDLLFAFFNVSDVRATRSRESTIKRNIALKQRMQEDFLKPGIGHRPSGKRYERFQYSEIIIHSVEDASYPGVDESLVGPSGWFKIEPFDFYFNGLEVILFTARIVMDSEGHWAEVISTDKFDNTRFRNVNAIKLGRIPFSNIVEYDLDGDEYYHGAHIYCTYANAGMPYEGFRYVLINGDLALELSADNRVDLSIGEGK